MIECFKTRLSFSYFSGQSDLINVFVTLWVYIVKEKLLVIWMRTLNMSNCDHKKESGYSRYMADRFERGFQYDDNKL